MEISDCVLFVLAIIIGLFLVILTTNKKKPSTNYRSFRGGAISREEINNLLTKRHILRPRPIPQNTNSPDPGMPHFKCSYCRDCDGYFYDTYAQELDYPSNSFTVPPDDAFVLVVPTIHISLQWDATWTQDCLFNLDPDKKQTMVKYIDAMEEKALEWAKRRSGVTARIAPLDSTGQHYIVSGKDPRGMIYPYFHWPNEERHRDGRVFDHIHLQVPMKLETGFTEEALSKYKEKEGWGKLQWIYNNITGKVARWNETSANNGKSLSYTRSRFLPLGTDETKREEERRPQYIQQQEAEIKEYRPQPQQQDDSDSDNDEVWNRTSLGQGRQRRLQQEYRPQPQPQQQDDSDSDNDEVWNRTSLGQGRR